MDESIRQLRWVVGWARCIATDSTPQHIQSTTKVTKRALSLSYDAFPDDLLADLGSSDFFFLLFRPGLFIITITTFSNKLFHSQISTFAAFLCNVRWIDIHTDRQTDRHECCGKEVVIRK